MSTLTDVLRDYVPAARLDTAVAAVHTYLGTHTEYRVEARLRTDTIPTGRGKSTRPPAWFAWDNTVTGTAAAARTHLRTVRKDADPGAYRFRVAQRTISPGRVHTPWGPA